MSAVGTTFVNEVISALEKIRPEDEYQTDAGLRVHRGRADELEVKPSALPMIIVSTITTGSQSVKPRTNRKDREIQVVGIVLAEQSDYEPALDSLDEDITRALSELTDIDALPKALDVQISGGDYTHPEGGSSTAYTTYTATISYPLTTKPKA